LRKLRQRSADLTGYISVSSNKGSVEDVCPIAPVYMMYIPKKHSAEKKRLPYGSGQLSRQPSFESSSVVSLK